MSIRYQHKIRGLVDGQFVVAIPVNLVENWKNVYVSFAESGCNLVLSSGALPVALSKKELLKFTS